MNDYLKENPANYMVPFLWMHGEDEPRLREVIGAIHQSGIGALCVESRPHPDFLGPKWWQDMDVVLDECKKRGMKIWILDDERFPTGYSAGRAAGSPHRIRYLNERHVDIAGPQRLRVGTMHGRLGQSVLNGSAFTILVALQHTFQVAVRHSPGSGFINIFALFVLAGNDRTGYFGLTVSRQLHPHALT